MAHTTFWAILLAAAIWAAALPRATPAPLKYCEGPHDALMVCSVQWAGPAWQSCTHGKRGNCTATQLGPKAAHAAFPHARCRPAAAQTCADIINAFNEISAVMNTTTKSQKATITLVCAG